MPHPYRITDADVALNGSYVRVRKIESDAVPAERPVLVFLHDSLGCITLWRDFPELLAHLTNCNALIYDRQGYGQSAPFAAEKRTDAYLEQEAQLLPRLLQQCGVQQAILFGHSDGGSIALVAAALTTGLVQAIVTEGAHVFVEDITLAGIREAVTAYKTINLPEKLARYHGDKTDAVFSAWAYTWLMPEFRSWNIERYLPGITCPVLAIQGDLDEYGSAKQVEAITSQTSGPAVAHFIPDVGHTPHKEAADEVLAVAAVFINEVIGANC